MIMCSRVVLKYAIRLPIVFALQVARWQVARGKVAGGTKKIGKRGIPEKSIQNVAQLR